MFSQLGIYYRLLSRKFLTPQRTKKAISASFLALALFTGFLVPTASTYANARALGDLSTAQFEPIETATLNGLQSPLRKYSVSQYFSISHLGIDLDTEAGAPIYPIAEGQIKKINRWLVGYGNHLIVDHENNLQSLYAHLSSFAVEEGERVDKNTVLGWVGATGWATGPHLHLEIWQNGRALNPIEVLDKE